MARSIEVIKQQIIDAKNGEVLLSGLSSPSQTSLWNLWAYITAVSINLHEQLWDIFRTEIETIAASAAPGTPQWLRDKTLKFQYSATTPQILQLINFVPQYAVVDTTLQLVTQCSVKLDGNRVVVLKVAKGTTDIIPLGVSAPGVPLTPPDTLDNNPEINALKGYIDKIKFAGTSIRIVSLEADRLQVYADIYYDGQYVKNVVKDNVKAAITTYLQNIPFDGVVLNTKLVDAIQNVPGVVDIQLQDLRGRTFQQPYTNTTDILRTYTTEAGYIIPEDVENPDTTPGAKKYTLDNTLNMIVSA